MSGDAQESQDALERAKESIRQQVQELIEDAREEFLAQADDETQLQEMFENIRDMYLSLEDEMDKEGLDSDDDEILEELENYFFETCEEIVAELS